MRMKLAIAMASIGLLLSAGQLVAHHAFTAEFDADRPVELKGTVSKMEWINPHSWLHIDVKDDSGEVVTWAVELGAPNAMLRRGWNKNSIPIGTLVTVYGWQAKNRQPLANARDIVLPDGRKLFASSPGSGAPGDPGAGK